jgi:hypothetical protein
VPARIESFSPASLPITRISLPTRARSGASRISPGRMKRTAAGSKR